MKKYLFFAFALIAGALVFTSCDKKDKDEPETPPQEQDAVVFNATGELRGVMFPIYNDKQKAVITVHTKANTVDVKFVQARIASESETPQDIYIYNMPLNQGESHIKLLLADGSSYAPFPKSYAYAIMDEKQTTFNMHFGNDNEEDTQVYLVYNAMLKPEQPEEINPADYVGSMWRVDSVNYDGRPSSQPYVIAKFISESQVVLDGADTTTWSYKDGAFSIRRYNYEEERTYKVVEVNKTFAHLLLTDSENKELHIYASIIPASNGQKVTPSVENIVGTWRMDYTELFYSGTDAQGRHYESYQLLPSAQYHDLDIWEFRADGTYSVTYMLEKAMDMEKDSWYQEGEWHLKDGKIALCGENDPYLKEETYQTFIELTTNVMYLEQTISNSLAHNVFKTYFSKIK